MRSRCGTIRGGSSRGRCAAHSRSASLLWLLSRDYVDFPRRGSTHSFTHHTTYNIALYKRVLSVAVKRYSSTFSLSCAYGWSIKFLRHEVQIRLDRLVDLSDPAPTRDHIEHNDVTSNVPLREPSLTLLIALGRHPRSHHRVQTVRSLDKKKISKRRSPRRRDSNYHNPTGSNTSQIRTERRKGQTDRKKSDSPTFTLFATNKETSREQ